MEAFQVFRLGAIPSRCTKMSKSNSDETHSIKKSYEFFYTLIIPNYEDESKFAQLRFDTLPEAKQAAADAGLTTDHIFPTHETLIE